jgi:alpha-beta hydrolase superfamily lysophospholipase
VDNQTVHVSPWRRVIDRLGGRNVTVVHLHGLRDPTGKHDTIARRAQAKALTELVTDSRGHGT